MGLYFLSYRCHHKQWQFLLGLPEQLARSCCLWTYPDRARCRWYLHWQILKWNHLDNCNYLYSCYFYGFKHPYPFPLENAGWKLNLFRYIRLTLSTSVNFISSGNQMSKALRELVFSRLYQLSRFHSCWWNDKGVLGSKANVFFAVRRLHPRRHLFPLW